MDVKEFYKDTYGEDAPRIFNDTPAIDIFAFVEAYHKEQTKMPSEGEIEKARTEGYKKACEDIFKPTERYSECIKCKSKKFKLNKEGMCYGCNCLSDHLGHLDQSVKEEEK